MTIHNGLPKGTALLIQATLRMSEERGIAYVTFRMAKWALSAGYLSEQYGGSWQRRPGDEFRYRLTGEQGPGWRAALVEFAERVRC